MKLFNLTTLAVALFLMNACIYKPVSVNYNKETSFKDFKTFAWVPEKKSDSSRYKNDAVKNNTINYINHCLFLRGYRIDTLNPDLLVDLVLLDEKKVEVSPYYFEGDGYYPYNTYGYISSYTYEGPYSRDYIADTVKTSYLKRTITIHLIDKETKKVVWSGTTVGDIYDPKYIEKHIHPGIHRLMQKYPVEPVVKKIKF